MSELALPVPPSRGDPVLLGGWTVTALWAFGILALGGGAYSVFKTTNGVGSAALIAVGVLFMVLAAARQLPTTFESSGTKMTFTRVAEVSAKIAISEVQQRVEANHPESADAVREAAAETFSLWGVSMKQQDGGPFDLYARILREANEQGSPGATLRDQMFRDDASSLAEKLERANKEVLIAEKRLQVAKNNAAAAERWLKRVTDAPTDSSD